MASLQERRDTNNYIKLYVEKNTLAGFLKDSKFKNDYKEIEKDLLKTRDDMVALINKYGDELYFHQMGAISFKEYNKKKEEWKSLYSQYLDIYNIKKNNSDPQAQNLLNQLKQYDKYYFMVPPKPLTEADIKYDLELDDSYVPPTPTPKRLVNPKKPATKKPDEASPKPPVTKKPGDVSPKTSATKKPDEASPKPPVKTSVTKKPVSKPSSE